MITTVCGIHYFRASEHLDDLQRIILSIFTGGLISLFILGFMTLRVDGRAAILATLATVLSVSSWLLMVSPLGAAWFPEISAAMPDNFWISTFANLFLFGGAYGLSWWLGTRHHKALSGLTIWK